MGHALGMILSEHGISYVSVVEKRGIHDRSWEMSASIAAITGEGTFASGTVETYEDGLPVKGS